MNEEVLNIQVRSFLKHVGITSQREIESAILQAVKNGHLQGSETLKPTMILTISEIDLKLSIEGDIALE